MGVGGSAVDLELLVQGPAELSLRDHAPDGLLDDLFRILGQKILEGDLLDAAGIEEWW